MKLCITLCFFLLCSCSAWQRSVASRQWLELPSPESQDIETRERALLVTCMPPPTNAIGLVAFMLLADVNTSGGAIVERTFAYDGINDTMSGYIKSDNATWMIGLMNSVTEAVTTIGNWISNAASGAAGTFRSSPARRKGEMHLAPTSTTSLRHAPPPHD